MPAGLCRNSARWLADKGRYDEAETLVARIEAEPRKGALPPLVVEPHAAPQKTRLAELFAGIYRRRTILLWTQWAATFFVAYGYCIWLPTLYVRIGGLPVNDALLLTLVTWSATLTTMYTEAWLLEKIGRKPLFIFGFAMIALGGGCGAVDGAVLPCDRLADPVRLGADHGPRHRAQFLGLRQLHGRALSDAHARARHGDRQQHEPPRQHLLAFRRRRAARMPATASRASSRCSPSAGLIGLVVMIALGVETKGRTLEELSP